MKENKSLAKYKDNFNSYENLYFPSRNAAKKAGYKNREIKTFEYTHWKTGEQRQRHVVSVLIGYEQNNWHIHQWRHFKTTQEKRQWFSYVDGMNEVDLFVKSRRRCPNELPNSWDDYYCNHVKSNIKKSWKKTNKVRKQWMKNL